MSSLRRRFTPNRWQPHNQHQHHDRDSSTPDSEELSLVSTRELRDLENRNKKVKGTKRRFAWIFSLGGLFGLVLAGYLASNNDLIDLATLYDFNQILDVLPASFVNEARQFQVCLVADIAFEPG